MNIRTNAKKTDKENSSSKLIEREEVENSPFTIVSEEGKGHYVIMGDYRLTEATENKEELIKDINEKNWNFLTTVIGTLIDAIDRIKTIKTK